MGTTSLQSSAVKVVAALFVATAGVGGVGVWSSLALEKELIASETAAAASRNHLEADMMVSVSRRPLGQLGAEVSAILRPDFAAV